MRKVDTIILHHTAGSQGGERIRQDHIRRGWYDIFYHFVIEPDGKIFIGRDLSRPAGKRRTAIEIAIVGKLHLESMTEKQEISLIGLINALQIEFTHINKFYNHKDLAATICPGNIDIKNFLGEEVTELKDLKIRTRELEDKVNILQARFLMFESQMADLVSWREDLRAFVHGVIMPEVRYMRELRNSEIPVRGEGTE